jgi:branched-chain amino acid transport system substrate-binding protein
MTMYPDCSPSAALVLTAVPHGSLDNVTVLAERITITPFEPVSLEPVRVGFLSDMPVGRALGVHIDPIILGLEDAMVEGRLRRPVEILAAHVMGLPVGDAEQVEAALHYLVDEGCAIVLSVGVTDNALVLCPVINELEVPYITMAGTTRFVGEYCFSLANGGHGEEAAIVAAYCADQGYRKVVVTGEDSPGDAEYRCFFAEQASLYGVEIVDTHYVASGTEDSELDEVLSRFRDCEPDALVYCGFGLNGNRFNPALDRIGWQPPKVMNAAIMWAFSSPEWMEALNGWIGIEQTLGDHEQSDKNRNWMPMLDRYEARFGYRTDSTMVGLLYDQGRATAEAIITAPDPAPRSLKEGLERIKMMPTTVGGPRTYIGFGPGDHRGYRGDFMFMKQIRGGAFHLAGYHWPQWPSNRR